MSEANPNRAPAPPAPPESAPEPERINPHSDYPVTGQSAGESPGAQGVNSFLKLQLRIFPLVAILALIFSVVIIYFAITAR